MNNSLKCGDCSIEYQTRASIEVNGKVRHLKKPITFPVLRINGRVVMSITPQETEEMASQSLKAKGRALVAGLGLGVVLDMIRKKCSDITVVEKNPNVVDIYKLYRKSIGKKVAYDRVVVGTIEDALTGACDPHVKGPYDFIYLDTWYNGDYESLPHVNWMVQESKAMLSKKGRAEAWAHQAMRRSYIKECLTLCMKRRTMILRAEKDRVDTICRVFPLLGTFIRFFQENPRLDETAYRKKADELSREVRRFVAPLEVEEAIRTTNALHAGVPVDIA